MENEKTIYLIIHEYDTDGGFGDSVPQEEVICGTENKEKAEEYVKKYDNPQPYAEPYSTLYCHGLRIKEITIKELNLNKDPFENDDFNDAIKRYKEQNANEEIDDDE